MALLGERVRSSRATSSRATAPGTGPGGGRGSANGPVGTSARRPSRLPGLALAALGVVAASAVHLLVPAVPMLTAAVVLGIAAAHLPGIRGLVHGLARPGLTLAGKRLMRLGIVLLGLKLGLSDVLGLGWATVAMVAGVVTATFFGTVWLGRKLGLSGDQPVLIATGYSICGASAIGAVSDVRGSEERDVATSVALVTLCGTLAIAALPLLHQPLGLDDGQFGRWVGAGVHDVGQVVATAQTAGPDALGQAVLVKLVRVMALAPLVAAMVVAVRRRGSADAVPGQKRPRWCRCSSSASWRWSPCARPADCPAPRWTVRPGCRKCCSPPRCSAWAAPSTCRPWRERAAGSPHWACAPGSSSRRRRTAGYC